MDRFEFSNLREKWRVYFEEGKRDVFDTSSSEDSKVKRSTLKNNKAYVELFKMTPTTNSNHFNNTRPDRPLNDEIDENTASTSGVVGLPAAEHKLEQHSDLPKLQLHEMASNGNTVRCAQQYKHITYVHELEPILQQSDSKLAITADISQLQDEESLSGAFSQRYEHNTAHNMEPVLGFDSIGTTAQLREDQPWILASVNKVHGICVADLLWPKFANQQERRQTQSMSDQLFEFPMRIPMQPALLESNGNVYKLEDSAGPSTSAADNNHRSIWTSQIVEMFRKTQVEVRNETISQWNMLQMQNNCEAPRIRFRDTLSQRKSFLIQPFMHRHAQYKINLQPILEEESDTIQELVLHDLEQELHNAGSDLETNEEEPHVDQGAESDDSYEEYEDALSEPGPSSTSSTIAAPPNYQNSLFFNVLICIAIFLRTMEGGVLAELQNYASVENIILFLFIFFSLLCFCIIYDSMANDEDETVDNDPPVEDVEVQAIRRVALIHALDQMQADPQPDRNIVPAIDAPDATEPVPPEQDMERE